ncbi:probable RNA-directed DNA polymerase from transposon X-element isoform X1 [Syngnathus typhle]|uniref:probable RNA-directed DNA polymerase from transposon X-element isoform X1 n=1 Tax=Syngnathus typhle TaxID=161592 RepID=UPI002A6B574B|nr:probable RNA-directed DNA polymerase from transposon X-element isoform X1 [Syngnathus typhle]XP_061151099.1 probable RNA-directed DNA polymerase from transposon X-element isoform X1 [Syngnathus typhle]XP_061151100.1 probable RNA-directed DNA polymerase from transposon X-element isoform X1 [Syngnathus typhle]XP_061151101.1 probable RNA-directed DNA polymerase from transposon X-element isoform X1 [Syngnathus typhle]
MTATALSEILSPATTNFLTYAGSIDNLTNEFNATLLNAIDSVAPLRLKTRRRVPTPWFTDETRTLKQLCRKHERRWRLTKLEVFHQAWQDSLLKYKDALILAKTRYFSQVINLNKNNPKHLFDTVAKLTLRQPTPDSSFHSADEFMKFFAQKIESIRDEIKNSIPIARSSTPFTNADDHATTLSTFKNVSLERLTQIVSAAKQTTCLLDPLPAKLLKELFQILGPSVLNIINLSVSSGIVPTAFKTAIIKPLLKRPNLDPDCLSNYRPVSNLPFIAKLLEKVVAQQLIDYMVANNRYDTFQSGFRANHSTETALAKVTNDLLVAMDSNISSVLLLLDLSAAFDTVDFDILLGRLKSCVGISGSALGWFHSYLSNRTHRVVHGNASSELYNVTCGVPQGSVLGPILFNIYMIPLGDIIRKYNISFQCYADDTQLYMPLSMTDPRDCCNLEKCLAEIKQWMSLNFLRLNPDKTEMLIIGPTRYQHLFKETAITIDNRTITQSDTVTNLGVIFDQTLSFQKHIKNITRIAFFHLRNIAKIRPILSTGDAETIIHAFVTSRLDYCNVLFSGLPKSRIKSLQLVQNAAARLLSRTRKFDHITPILANLHWLPVHLRCDFKVLLLTYKSLHGLAPAYLVDLVVPYVPSRNLRSQNATLLATPRAKKMSAGSRAFSIRAPELWNALPMDIRTATSVETFKTRLKTHFYDMAFN